MNGFGGHNDLACIGTLEVITMLWLLTSGFASSGQDIIYTIKTFNLKPWKTK